MDPEMGKAGFRIAISLLLGSFILLPLVPPGSAEFFATIFTIMIGVVFIGLVLLLIRIFSR